MSILAVSGAGMGAGIAVRGLRRWQRANVLGTFISIVIIGALLAFAPSTPLYFFGRAFALDAPTRTFLLALFGATSALALFTPLTFERARDAPAQVVANSQGAFFFFAFASLVVAMTLDSFPLAVFAWAIGLIVLMLSARPQSEGRVGGAAQFLLLIVMASASLLLAHRFIELYPITPENLDLVRNAVIFLALGFGLLIAIAPLHIWLGPLADELLPLGVAFLVGVAQAVGVWLLWQQMNTVTWLVTRSPLLNALIIGGGLTAFLGALLALAERRDARALAYLAMVPLGQVCVGLGVGTSIALAGALGALANRAWSVALIAGGMSFARHHSARRWQLIGAGAIVLGGIALAGIAPSLGWSANYAIGREVSARDPLLFAVLVASNALALLAIARITWRIVSARSEAEESNANASVLFAGVVAMLVLVAMLVGAGMFPQMLEPIK
ncbi:MAG: proton-conducting transporter membrane subunit [Anaerolineae bacterium]|nr:proton-conducting transporter membrane subunit [Anaerolineae bacterium]